MNAYCPKCKEQKMEGDSLITVDGIRKPILPNPMFKCSKCGTMLRNGIVNKKPWKK